LSDAFIMYGEQCFASVPTLTEQADTIRYFAASIRTNPEIVRLVQPGYEGLTALREALANVANAIDGYLAAYEAAKELQQ
jgi:hypothetical protein